MTSFPKHLQLNNIFLIFFAAALISGCGKENKKIDYIAKVNNSYLTKDEFLKLAASDNNKNFHSAEIIRNWINRELLFQEAKSEGIDKKKEFQKIIEDAKKDLAIAELLKNHYDDLDFKVDQNELDEYFSLHKDEFKTVDEFYKINFISFTNEDKAVQFRSTVLESNWSKALIAFKGEPSINIEKTNWFVSEYEIEPIILLRLITELNDDEVSIVLPDDQNMYLIVQLIQKFEKGIVPPFNLINKNVEKRFMAEKKETAIRDYIKELYSKNEIEVKN